MEYITDAYLAYKNKDEQFDPSRVARKTVFNSSEDDFCTSMTFKKGLEADKLATAVHDAIFTYDESEQCQIPKCLH